MDVAAAREVWQAERAALQVGRLVFLDETWATTSMTPARGRAPRGQRCPGALRWLDRTLRSGWSHQWPGLRGLD